MIKEFWNLIFYNPLHNTLAALIHIIPWGDVGLAVIVLTLLVKIILYPLSKKALKSQIALKKLEPELARIKEEYKDNKEEQAKQTFALYKTANVNPFSGCLVVLIQFPIIIALYYVFLKGIAFSPDSLYSFISVPDVVSMKFLGLIDITQKKNIIIAIITALSQFAQARFSMAQTTPTEGNDFKAELARSMSVQMKYVLPVFIGFISYTMPVAVSLYWITSNIFTLAQEWYIRKNA